MTIKPICAKCQGEIKSFGGLAFSPPARLRGVETTKKLHLCVECWELFMKWLLKI